jgi:3-oxoacyl-[acyl-carrier-protein] synthase II
MRSDAARGARVFVIGVGVVSSIGSGRAAFARALRAGASGIGPVTLFDVADQKTGIAAEVPGFSPADVLPASRRAIGSRSDALAIAAAREAAREARLAPALLRRAGLFVGTTTAGMLENEGHLAELVIDPTATQPLVSLLSHPLSAPADRVAEALGSGGPRRTVCSACSSSAHAIAMAADAIRRGACDVALAGGTDALCRLTYSGFNALGALDGDPCRPFDASRRGLNLGEAGAFLVLAREGAVPAGATILAELAGVGSLSEAHHITNPLASGEGARRVMELALADAGLGPEAIGYVSAHGTGTPLNDPMEARAILAVLGDRAGEVWVSSTKSQIGHTLGAAGAVEAVASLLAMDGEFVPPTIRLASVDPAAAGLRHVGTTAREARFDAFLSNSFGFGGADVSLCFARPGLAPARRPAPRPALVVTGVGARLPAGARDALDALEAEPPPPTGATASPDALDPARARRLDRFARLATDAADQALVEAHLPDDPAARARVGAALGTMWGSLDASASFMRRVIEQGARRAMPADFPNLVLSSGAGHLGIYHGLRGPAWTVSAWGASGLGAIVSAAEEIAIGRADAMVAGGVETTNDVVLRVLEIFRGPQVREMRSEGAAAVVLEAESAARARGATPLARVVLHDQRAWVPDDDADREAVIAELLAELASVAPGARLYVPTLDAPIVRAAAAAIGAERVVAIEPRAGAHEAGGSVAAALAARAVASGAVRHAVVLQEIPAAVWVLALAG